MVKNKIRDNVLIRRCLVGKLKEEGIVRVNRGALDEIDDFISEELDELAELLGFLLVIKGKKTLERKDVAEVVEDIKKRSEYFEI